MTNILKLNILLFLTLWIIGSSCKKMLDVKSSTIITPEITYSDSTMTESNINGIYFNMQQQGTFYNASYFGSFPLLSDEAEIGTTFSAANFEFASNKISTNNSLVSGMWQNGFKVIFQANSVLENLPTVSFLTEKTKNQFIGEAKFLRAYSYFILTQYFGKLPLIKTTDYVANTAMYRSDTSEINKFILDELLQAEGLLTSGYSNFQNKRIRVSMEVAQALLARIYLYRGDWQNAEIYASKVIGNPLFTMESLNNVFSEESKEVIWKLWMTTYQNFTSAVLVPYSLVGPSKPEVVLSSALVTIIDAGDNRKNMYMYYSSGTDSYYSYKYHDLVTYADDPVIFRLAEMYLIRAEARAQQDNLTGNESASSDINNIRSRARAELLNVSLITKNDILDTIMRERFIELCFEGHRWPDLIRTGRLDSAMRTYKPSTWTPAAPVLFPIPASEIGLNPHLLPQNEGYN